MKRTGQGSIILLAVLSVAIIFIALIGATFAYFTVNLHITETEKHATIQARTLVIEFASNNNIYYDWVIPGRPKWPEGTIASNKLKFSVTSPVDMKEKNVYDVYFNIETNTFVTNNMVFYLKQNECIRKDGTGSKLGEIISQEFVYYDDDGVPLKLGVIPAGYTGKLKINGGAILGSLGCRDEWEFELWLNETGVEQNEDQARLLKGSIEIETGTIYPMDFDIGVSNKDDGNEEVEIENDLEVLD